MQTEDDRKNPLEHYLGATIRELRQRHGLTIAQVCEQAGVHPQEWLNDEQVRGRWACLQRGTSSVSVDFLQSTYEAAANAAKWDRDALECPLGQPGVVREIQ